MENCIFYEALNNFEFFGALNVRRDRKSPIPITFGRNTQQLRSYLEGLKQQGPNDFYQSVSCSADIVLVILTGNKLSKNWGTQFVSRLKTKGPIVKPAFSKLGIWTQFSSISEP